MSKSDYDKAMFRLTTMVMRMNVGKRVQPKLNDFNVGPQPKLDNLVWVHSPN